MSKFIFNNFEKFQEVFEETFQLDLCHWVEKHIIVKESSRSKPLDLPKWFLCKCLLTEPEKEILDLCENLFSKIKNLNGRSTHTYVSNQVFGTLKECLHVEKLKKKYPDYRIRIVSSEFDAKSQTRAIFTKNIKSISRKPDLEVRFKEFVVPVHIKANDTFLKSHKLTFRGGSNPEYELIAKGREFVHLILSHDQYLSIKSMAKLSEHIERREDLSKDKMWGGKGAVRFYFKPSIMSLVQNY